MWYALGKAGMKKTALGRPITLASARPASPVGRRLSPAGRPTRPRACAPPQLPNCSASPPADCLWASWSCVAASSTHTKETSGWGRALAVSLTLGGLLSYSLLTGAVSSQMQRRLESLRLGAEYRPIPEAGHVVVAGSNSHLLPLLRQLDRSRAFARAATPGRVHGRQTVVLLLEPGMRPRVEAAMRQQQLPELNVVTRSGQLDDPGAFQR